jgi:hypothetical protein
MNLYVTSAYRTHACLDRLRELYEMDAHETFGLAHDPAEADAIVFVENTHFHDLCFETVTTHPLVKRYPEKVYMYNEMDLAWPLLPGLYCSLTHGLATSDDYVAFPYLTAANSSIQHIHAANTRRKWLFSFVGSISHPSRKPLFKLAGNEARVVDTSEFCTWNPAQTSRYAYQKLYTDTIAASKFVLCPRGIGPASLRLFETIEAGRVPVIISDSWVAPPQINWDFAVRIPESAVASIPDVLSRLEPEWQERGHAARAAWESAYAPDQLFNTLGRAIQGISRSVNLPKRSLRVTTYKWRALLEQQLRHRIKSPAGRPESEPTLLGRLFSR